MSQEEHSLGGGSSSNIIDDAKEDLDNFPTANIYDGGCAECACEIPIELKYEKDDAPVPDAEFVVKWGEQEEGEEGEIIVTPKTDAQKAAPEIKGVVDTNGLARVKNSPCGSYVVLFGEGSDALKVESLDEKSDLYLAIEDASAKAGVGSLTPTGRGQLMWWLVYWTKQKAAKYKIEQIRHKNISDKTEITAFVEKHGKALWTDNNGQVDQRAKSEVLQELRNDSLADIATDNWNPFSSDGALVRLEQELNNRLDHINYPDDPAANKVAKELETTLVNGIKIPDSRFYKILQNIGQAERVAAQLFDPDADDGWDVFLLVAEAILGFIPVVGDIIDVIDIIRWVCQFLGDDGETPTTWDYIELGALSLGFIPVAGFFLKKAFAPIARFFAGIRGASKASGKASDLLQETIKVLRNVANGNLVKWIRKKQQEVKHHVDFLKEKMVKMCESVIAALKEYIDKLWFRSRFAEKILTAFKTFKDKVEEYLDLFFEMIDELVKTFIKKIANRFTATTVAKNSKETTVFKLGRRQADGSGGLAKKGHGKPKGPCPKAGQLATMGTLVAASSLAGPSSNPAEESNPVNMILGQPFINQVDISAGHFTLERTWTPGQGGGLFGPHWSTPLSNFVEIGPEGAIFQTAMGRKIPFDVPFDGAVCVNIHDNNYKLMAYGNGYAIEDANNLLWIYQWHDGMVRRLSAVRDSNGQGFDIAYAPDTEAPIGLKPTQITLTNGDIYDLEVQGGRLQRVHHRASGIIEAEFDYNEQGLLIGASDAAGYRMGYAYDSKRRVVGLDYNGEHCTAYEYDNQNRVIGVATDTDYYHDRFDYGQPNSEGVRAVSFINTLGERKSLHIDSEDQVIAVIEPQGRVNKYHYNQDGDVVRVITPQKSEFNYQWDTLSNLLAITYPDGSTEAFERDKRGRLLSYTDQGGAQWQYERDDKGNIIAEHSPDGRCWRYQLNERGQATRIYQPDGSIVTLAYNAQQRLSQWTDALGATTTFTYNSHGQLSTRTYPDGTATHFQYDTMGRITAATLANGSSLQWRWSARGDLIEAIDGEGKKTQRQYGPYGLLQAVTDPSGGTVHFEYDQLLRLTDVINENNERYRYDYDASGSVTKETDFSGRQLLYRYNNAGQLIEKTAGDGVKTHYHYNVMGQPIRQELFDRGEQKAPTLTRFAYDKRGHITAAQNRDATIEFERDELGRIVSESINGRIIESNYNALGELASKNFDGRLAHYHYDANGLLNTLTIGKHAPLQFERDLMGRERSRRSGAGFIEQRQWSQIGQLKTQIAGKDSELFNTQHYGFQHQDIPTRTQGDIGAARSYHYDKAFNPTVINDARSGSTHYHYNANNQITKVDYQQQHQQAGLIQERFHYDKTKNIVSVEQQDKGTSLSLLQDAPVHNTHNSIKRTAGGRIQRRGDTTYAYDAQGRMIGKRVDKNGFRPQKWSYQWNGEDQLTRVTTPDNATWEYQYDPFGRRIGKSCIQAGTKHQRHKTYEQVNYLWSGNLLSEERRIYADGTEQTVAYHYEQDSFVPIAQEVDGELSYIVTDHLGTPKELISEEGEVRWYTRHQLWGRTVQLKTHSNNAANDDCHLRFQGQLEDEESGLYYNRFRYYDPESGDYLSQDPIGLKGGLRPNGYVETPTTWIDPFGLSQDKSKPCKEVAKKVPNPGGRLGKQSTRQHIDEVATEMEKRGFTITDGGNRLPEEYLPGPGGGRKGSSFPDITATKNGRTVRVNTVDTRADGLTPSTREARNAARIRSQTPGDHLLLIPKP
ncbi:RHS repeat-associated core domain-containing protein [Agarilytica rhodophyticola]|uniref:RHS repeat-associated core domain-containing protein n=1 Tax=Agarilytica rhodophyticola TaxID=1737490 RepID=UPI000B347673|nr:RHS repeat-associated core domain-containing protein [Agarilytica rhodophyticola]